MCIFFFGGGMLSSWLSCQGINYSFSLSNSDLTIRIPLLITSVFVVCSFSAHLFNTSSVLSSSRNSNCLCFDLFDFGLGETLIPPLLCVQEYQ